MKKTIYILIFLLAAITAASIVLFFHIQDQGKIVDALGKSNRRYISENICLKAEIDRLTAETDKLTGKIFEARRAAAMLSGKIAGITPFISGIVEQMSGDSWCGIGSWLHGNKAAFTEWCDWVNSNLPVKPENNDITTGIIFPNGGENLICGKTYNIQWMNVPGVKNVRIEFYNGATWKIITNGTENDGNFSWEVPCEITGKAKLYIAGIGKKQAPGDVLYSQGNFSISESDEKSN